MANRTSNEEFLEEIFTDFDGNQWSSEARCRKFIAFYRGLSAGDKRPFLLILAQKYGLDNQRVLSVANNAPKDDLDLDLTALTLADKMRAAILPKHKFLFSQVARVDGGLKFLVDMRADLLDQTRQRSNTEQESALFQELNVCLRELFTLWFTSCFLDLERVTWASPCQLLQKIWAFEAVHPVQSWKDIQRRVGPYRRCFVYIHRAIPGIPVVVLHTALVPEISSCLQTLIDKPVLSDTKASNSTEKESGAADDKEVTEDPSQIKAAIFYSITSTQKGLQGIEMGKHLIKATATSLLKEFPEMTQFSSLSPIPGFRDWLLATGKSKMEKGDAFLLPEEQSTLAPFRKEGEATPLATFLNLVTSHEWYHRAELVEVMKAPLMRLCTSYLYREKRRTFALNPVANFHLGNGAELWRINYLADCSQRGMDQACGLMVNYRYYPDKRDSNSSAYLQKYQIKASEQVLKLLKEE